MKTLLAAVVLGLTVVVPASAADLVRPRKGEVPASGQYVPVSLDGYARHRVGAVFSDKHVTIRGIPFDLVNREDADNLFLKSAGWPDWQEDPSRYYAAYDKGPETPGDPRRPIFKIPVADYTAVYVLAAADKDSSLSNVVSFRIGALDGPRRTTLHDFSAEVPRLDSQRAPAGSTAVPTKAGNLFLVRVPLGEAFAQDFHDAWAFDVEVTKELRLAIRRPDPCRFQIRPLGIPSGVHLFGMTFQRSPIQMEVSSDQAGHVFNEPQRPTFHVRLHNIGQRGAVAIEATATDYYGQTTVVRTDDLTSKPGQHLTHEIVLPVKRRGDHELAVRVLRGRSELLRRDTTFAVLPPDTRRHRDSSPLGTWGFSGAHYTPNDPDQVGPLYVKAGLRYGMFGFSAEERKRYGVLVGPEPRNAEGLSKALEKDPSAPKRVLIFHENAISGAHVMRTPDVFAGRTAYKLDAKEQAKLEAMSGRRLSLALQQPVEALGRRRSEIPADLQEARRRDSREGALPERHDHRRSPRGLPERPDGHLRGAGESLRRGMREPRLGEAARLPAAA